jgi:poly-gamma-glutamate capsule biosynthesis protein CapA/YwtB (metallophosphatase superfamily)
MRLKIILIIIVVFLISTIGLWIYYSKTSFQPSAEIAGTQSENIPKTPLFTFQTPNIDQIFSMDHNWTATLSAEKIRVLIATGDVIPARSVNYQSTRRKNFQWSFEKAADFLKNADLTLINLESPLISNCPLTNTGMIFCGDTRNIEGLVFAGVDVASLVNNHFENYGEKGVSETVKLLNEADILPVVENQPQVKDIRGLRFGFVSFHDLPQSQLSIEEDYAQKIASQVASIKKQADIVLVSFHWGVEYTPQPTKRQQDLARLAIDNGADLIIGNHPHWIQPVEIYKDKLIVYAHGNFVFDQMWSEKTKEGVVGRYTFLDNQLIDAEFLPVKIIDYGQPYFLEGEQKKKILDSMFEESKKLLSF